MSNRIHQPGHGANEGRIFRPQPIHQGPKQPQNSAQDQAKSSYTFQDSRHVVKGGIAAVNLNLTEEEQNEPLSFLGFEEGDIFHIQGPLGLEGSLSIITLNEALLALKLVLNIPVEAQVSAGTAFSYLSQSPYYLNSENQLAISIDLFKNNEGHCGYCLKDLHNKDKTLSADRVDIRIDEWTQGTIQHQVTSFISTAGNSATLALEAQPQVPISGQFKLSLAPSLGAFELSPLKKPKPPL